jgi:hypothetical protein
MIVINKEGKKEETVTLPSFSQLKIHSSFIVVQFHNTLTFHRWSKEAEVAATC